MLTFRPQDFFIKKTKAGDEVINLSSRLAFDKEFINEMRKEGVKDFIERDQNGDEVEE